MPWAHRKAPEAESGQLLADRAFVHDDTEALLDLALQIDAPLA
jgi:hypothetical protein